MTKETIIRHAISLGITFVATFFLVMSFEVMSPDFIFSTMAFKALALSALITAARSVAKIVYEICYNLLGKK